MGRVDKYKLRPGEHHAARAQWRPADKAGTDAP
jgi:hypothetical protein